MIQVGCYNCPCVFKAFPLWSCVMSKEARRPCNFQKVALVCGTSLFEV
uniref:Uncharacterized protein n=1 Tax=Anguilla anguilla TaxID=7936 RepID=A0A0E9WP30_ANGAN